MTTDIELRWSRNGDAIARFWLWNDAEKATEALSRTYPDDEYWLVGPTKSGSSVSVYRSGIREFKQ